MKFNPRAPALPWWVAVSSLATTHHNEEKNMATDTKKTRHGKALTRKGLDDLLEDRDRQELAGMTVDELKVMARRVKREILRRPMPDHLHDLKVTKYKAQLTFLNAAKALDKVNGLRTAARFGGKSSGLINKIEASWRVLEDEYWDSRLVWIVARRAFSKAWKAYII